MEERLGGGEEVGVGFALGGAWGEERGVGVDLGVGESLKEG